MCIIYFKNDTSWAGALSGFAFPSSIKEFPAATKAQRNRAQYRGHILVAHISKYQESISNIENLSGNKLSAPSSTHTKPLGQQARLYWIFLYCSSGIPPQTILELPTKEYKEEFALNFHPLFNFRHFSRLLHDKIEVKGQWNKKQKYTCFCFISLFLMLTMMMMTVKA